MKRFCYCFLLCLAAIAGPVLFGAAPPTGSKAEVERLIEQLGSEKFAGREAASKRLAAIGEPALDALHKALSSRDLEVRCRARRIVAAVENRLYGPELRLTGHTSHVWSVCVSADGKRVLTSSSDSTLRLWDADTGQCLRVFEGHAGRVAFGAALSPDGKLVLSGSDDKTLRLWDVDTGKELRKLTGPGPPIASVCFSSDGKHLLSAAPNDNTVRVWDVESGTELKRITAAGPYNAAFSPDGKRIVSGGLHDNTVRVWDAASGKELRHYEGHTASVAGVAYFPDGKRIASASFD